MHSQVEQGTARRHVENAKMQQQADAECWRGAKQKPNEQNPNNPQCRSRTNPITQNNAQQIPQPRIQNRNRTQNPEPHPNSTQPNLIAAGSPYRLANTHSCHRSRQSHSIPPTQNSSGWCLLGGCDNRAKQASTVSKPEKESKSSSGSHSFCPPPTRRNSCTLDVCAMYATARNHWSAKRGRGRRVCPKNVKMGFDVVC
jgi:hypothetical protein